MLKKEREIKDKNIIEEIIKKGKFANISMCRDNEPYIVTLSYGYDSVKNSLYFHSAKIGLKFDFIRKNSLVCGTIVEDKGYKINQCSHAYRSVVFWGKMVIVEDLEEKKHGFEVMMNHLEENPNKIKKRFLEKEDTYRNTSILRLDINEITGKASE